MTLAKRGEVEHPAYPGVAVVTVGGHKCLLPTSPQPANDNQMGEGGGILIMNSDWIKAFKGYLVLKVYNYLEYLGGSITTTLLLLAPIMC